MTKWTRNDAFVAVSFVILMVTGCAHAPAPLREPMARTALVTGSRIPQPLDAEERLSSSSSPVRVYSRQQMIETGRQFDTASALRDLDLSFGWAGQPFRR